VTTVLMNPSADDTTVILASGSATRAGILRNAGLRFSIRRPTVDEAAVRQVMVEAGDPVEAGARRLADLKALEISSEIPGALVIGADQILECGGQWFEKPEGPEAAREQLMKLSGRTHRLISGVSIARDNEVIWRHVDQAVLTVRSLGKEFLERYLIAMGDRTRESVGGYQIEGLGSQLFERVEGDHFTILGLPLLPTLAFLRSQGLLED
jgi:septum formation protein